MIARSTDIKAALRSRQRGFFLNPYRFAAPTPGAVNVLAHFDGANGSTAFVESSSGKTITRSGSTIFISTAQSKFGGASAGPFGAGYLSVPMGAAAGNFSLGCWFYWTGASGNKGLLTTADSSEIYIQGSTSMLYFYRAGVNRIVGAGAAAAPAANTWNLAMLERVGSTIRLTLNGVSIGTCTDSTTFTAGNLLIGAYTGGSELFAGYIDEVYYRVGGALFGGVAFAPPAAAFTI